MGAFLATIGKMLANAYANKAKKGLIGKMLQKNQQFSPQSLDVKQFPSTLAEYPEVGGVPTIRAIDQQQDDYVNKLLKGLRF